MQPTAMILASELKERGLSIRGLARVLAGGDEDAREIEQWRRALYRYLGGGEPEDKQASIMEQRLDLPAGTFPRFDRKRPLADGNTFGERLSRIESRQEELANAVASHTRTLRALQQELRAARRERGG